MTLHSPGTPAATGRPRLERVVVGIDFTPASVDAASWVAQHLAPEAEHVLVHALKVPEPPRFLREAVGGRSAVLAEARREAVHRLEGLREELSSSGVRIEVREGAADRVLSDVTEEIGADLVVVGEHGAGTSGRRRRGPGTTAERMLHESPAPVLLARNPPAGAPRRALVAVDDSDRARGVLEWAAFLRRAFETEITACHVFRPLYAGVSGLLSGDEAARGIEPAQRRQARAWLEDEVRSAGLPPEGVGIEIDEGDPAREILSREEEGAPDLVVMGSRGAGTVGRVLLGSVAGALIREGSRPVLVVRPGT